MSLKLSSIFLLLAIGYFPQAQAQRCVKIISGGFPVAIIMKKKADTPTSKFSPTVGEAVATMDQAFANYFEGRADWEVVLEPVGSKPAMDGMPMKPGADLYSKEQAEFLKETLGRGTIAGYFIKYAANPEFSTEQAVTPFIDTVVDVQLMDVPLPYYRLFLSSGEEIRWTDLKLLYREIKP